MLVQVLGEYFFCPPMAAWGLLVTLSLPGDYSEPIPRHPEKPHPSYNAAHCHTRRTTLYYSICCL